MKTMLGVLIAGVMVAASACSMVPLAPPTVNITGNWVGTWSYDNVQMGSGDITGSFQQDGQKLSGNFHITGPVLNHVAMVVGAVSGNEILLNQPSTGRLTVNGNTITGIVNGLNQAKLTLTKQ